MVDGVYKFNTKPQMIEFLNNCKPTILDIKKLGRYWFVFIKEE